MIRIELTEFWGYSESSKVQFNLKNYPNHSIIYKFTNVFISVAMLVDCCIFSNYLWPFQLFDCVGVLSIMQPDPIRIMCVIVSMVGVDCRIRWDCWGSLVCHYYGCTHIPNHGFPTNTKTIWGGLLNGVARQRCCELPQPSFAPMANKPLRHWMGRWK